METDKENNPEFVEHAQSNTSDQQAGNCTCGQPNPQAPWIPDLQTKY